MPSNPVAADLRSMASSAVSSVVGPWWRFVLRGALAILFGILSFVVPHMALLTLVIIFGIYALSDGFVNLAAGLQRAPPVAQPRWALLLAGVVSVLAGIAAFVWPGITALSLLFVIAAWAIVRGVFEIVAAINLRKEIDGEWMLALGGLLSVGFGVLLFVHPGAGALAVVWWIGAYAVILGLMLVSLGFKLRSWTRGPHSGFRHATAGGVP
jgi:uncharacterized membrane protein HdeD (DUF308 family)